MKFIYQRTLYLADTDAAGVIYFARGLNLCHEAYEAFLIKQGVNLPSLYKNPQVAYPIVHAEIDFFRPLRSGDRLHIHLTATAIGETGFTLSYRLYFEDQTDPLLAQAQTKHIAIAPETRQRHPLPASKLEMLEILAS
ncbi:MAG: thioesterase family protein [Cyanobacteria bacterium P01_H01_bin.15]